VWVFCRNGMAFLFYLFIVYCEWWNHYT